MKQHTGFVQRTAIIAILVLLIGGGLVYALIPSSRTLQMPVGDTNRIEESPPPASLEPIFSDESTAQPTQKRITAKDILGSASAFHFTAMIPALWETEAIGQSQALNIYDPAADGKTSLEKSQIFIKFFRANSFLTLSTVDILERTAHSIQSRPAVTYTIEKKGGVPNFQGQPLWRNVRHRVTDIRESDQNPATFYVFAKRPEVSSEVFDEFLQSLVFGDETASSIIYPVENFLTGITKKPFGIFVSPEQSPISPERFRGFHTGVDVEAPSGSPGQTTPVYAIADGTVLISQSASGYGGVLALRHILRDNEMLAVYGHLSPSSLVPAGARVQRGERIGVLGKEFSSETDLERAHLHFGLYQGSGINIKGYVPGESDLSQWLDPVAFFRVAATSSRTP